MPKNRDRKPTARVSMNPITHALESVVLDDVQRAHDRIRDFIESRMLTLGGSAERENLARKLLETVGRMIRHTGGERGT